MDDRAVWEFIATELAAGARVALVAMVDASGSGPNRPGAKLAVGREGRRIGTVGGGKSEYALVNLAVAALAKRRVPKPRLVTMEHQAGSAEASGMICSGTQVFARVVLTSADTESVERINRAVACRSPGTLQLSADGLAWIPGASHLSGSTFEAEPWCYSEAAGVPDTVTLIGGGHVSLALTPLLRSLGMRVVVLDNRPHLETMETNCAADERHVVDYAAVAAHVPTGPHSFVCIMTFGHQHDREVLAQLVEYPLAYLGMMGSAVKIEQIRLDLLDHGISPGALDAVHAPIGVSIGSNTPEEIAISIAAEIICVRNAPNQDGTRPGVPER